MGDTPAGLVTSNLIKKYLEDLHTVGYRVLHFMHDMSRHVFFTALD